ncbi:hypothetical protein M601_019865 [Cellulophaga baltica 4]|nr:hypothetical protein M601_019865 [Cellulophaga baltica 4]
MKTAKNTDDLAYFFLGGMYKYEQHGWEIVASGIPVNVSVERNGDTFVLESDGPILIRAPFLKGEKIGRITSL